MCAILSNFVMLIHDKGTIILCTKITRQMLLWNASKDIKKKNRDYVKFPKKLIWIKLMYLYYLSYLPLHIRALNFYQSCILCFCIKKKTS